MTSKIPGLSHATRTRLPSCLGLLALCAGCSMSDEVSSASTGVQSPDGTYSLFAPSAVPAHPAETDAHAVELGVRFRADVGGTVTAVRFYKSAQNTGVHTGHLWSAGGTLLATVTFSNETTSGWQTARFSTPVTLRAGRTYIASYHTNVGYYAGDNGYFAARSVDNGPLHAPADGSTAHNGVYHYGATAFPSDSWQASNYWVDVVFRPTASTTTDAGAVTDTGTPATDSSTTTDAGTPATDSSTTTDASAPATDSGTPPTMSGFPDATHTGIPAGVTLRAVPGQVTSGPGWHWDSRGWLKVDAANAVLDGLDIQGPVDGNQSGLTIKNSRIRCLHEDSWCLTMLGSRSTITDSEIGGGADGRTTMGANGILSGGSSAGNLVQRVNIHHVVHGIHIDGGTTLVDSFIHDLPMGDPGFEGAHTECIFISTGWNTVVRHNRFETGNSAEIFAQNYDNSAEGTGNLTIENNFFFSVVKNGQVSSWAIAIENKAIRGPITIRDNTFTRGWEAGPILAPIGATVSGNVYTDGSAAPTEFAPVVY